MIVARDLYLQKLISRKHNGMIKVITGMRRCGKSFLLFELFNRHLLQQGVDKRHIIKIDLEDRRNQELRDPDKLLAYIDGRMAGDGQMHYILLDEIQRVAEFEDVLNSYLKVRNADVYVTGSNSKLLSKDIITEFRGRSDEVRIHPFCFQEYLSAKQGMDRQAALHEYMTFGGLPQCVLAQTTSYKTEYLDNLFRTTYLRDVKERYSIRNDADLEEMVDVLASSLGSLVNPLKIQNTFKSVKGSSINYMTIKRYIDYLEDAFLIDKAVRYDIQGRRYIDTPMKYYFEDIGLRNACLRFRQSDEGHIMENIIYNELVRRGLAVDVGQVVENGKDDNGKSYRRTLEVDFVCNRGFKRYYVQSALKMPTAEKMRQEEASLMNIKDSFPKIIIVGSGPSYINNDGVTVLNIYDFLMSDNSLEI